MMEVGGFQTKNTKMINLLSSLSDYAHYQTLLITGEVGSGRRLLAQEIAQVKQVKNMRRFVSGGNLTEIRSGDCVLVEELESLLPHEQQFIAKLIDEIENVQWILISSHDVVALADRALVSRELVRQIEREIQILPLRDRKEDLEPICDSVLATLAWMTGKIKKLDFQAQEKIKKYSWPGNVSELEKTLEKAFLKSQSNILTASDLEIRDGVAETFQLCTLNEMERKLILQTLQITQNNKSQAARILGISIRTLRNKLSVYKQEGLYESNV